MDGVTVGITGAAMASAAGDLDSTDPDILTTADTEDGMAMVAMEDFMDPTGVMEVDGHTVTAPTEAMDMALDGHMDLVTMVASVPPTFGDLKCDLLSHSPVMGKRLLKDSYSL